MAQDLVLYAGRLMPVSEWRYQMTWEDGIDRPYVAPPPWGGDRSPLLVLPGPPPPRIEYGG